MTRLGHYTNTSFNITARGVCLVRLEGRVRGCDMQCGNRADAFAAKNNEAGPDIASLTVK